MGIYSTTVARGMWLYITRYQVHQNWRHGSNVMKSAQDDRLLSANDVINLIFKMAPRVIKRVYRCGHILLFFSRGDWLASFLRYSAQGFRVHRHLWNGCINCLLNKSARRCVFCTFSVKHDKSDFALCTFLVWKRTHPWIHIISLVFEYV